MSASDEAWARLRRVVEEMTDVEVGQVEHMAKWARANLTPGLVALVPLLDAARGLADATIADRHGCTAEEVRRIVAEVLAEDGEHDG